MCMNDGHGDAKGIYLNTKFTIKYGMSSALRATVLVRYKSSTVVCKTKRCFLSPNCK
jgi:hypothetical protein